MSGHQVRCVAGFELEIVSLRVVMNTVPLLVKQVHMLVEFHRKMLPPQSGLRRSNMASYRHTLSSC